MSSSFFSHLLLLIQASDGNIRYFEYAQDKFEFLSEYKSADPQRGIAFLPKRGINTHENEVMRAFKTVNDSYIEPISFIVPRRAEVFQDDIYPPVYGSNPAMSSKEWFDGKEGFPSKIDLASVYAGEGPTAIPAGNKPVLKDSTPLQPPAPVKKDADPFEKEVVPVKEAKQPSPALCAPPPSMKEQAGSIANLASKFADKDDDDSDRDGDEHTSSFEEVSKPVDRSQRIISKAEDHSETRGHVKADSTTISSSVPAAPLSRLPVEIVPAQTKVCKSTLFFVSHFIAKDRLASRFSCQCFPTLIVIHIHINIHKSTHTLLSPGH